MITVAQLIEALRAFPEDAPVVITDWSNNSIYRDAFYPDSDSEFDTETNEEKTVVYL